MSLEIISATYEGADVRDILSKLISDDELNLSIGNYLFGDPASGVLKTLKCKYILNGEEGDIEVEENKKLVISESFGAPSRILLLTSCNRIKQTVFALIVNSYIIGKKFSVIVSDGSTTQLLEEDALEMHKQTDTYNYVSKFNYCSDITLFERHIKLIPNITDYKILHVRPRMDKEQGEMNLIALGLSQASIMGNSIAGKTNVCLKLSGVEIMNYNLLADLPNLLKDCDVLTYQFNNNDYSTRIFGCRPEILSKLIMDEGWHGWIDKRFKFVEEKFSTLINKRIQPNRINKLGKGENHICLIGTGGGGKLRDEARQRITTIIKDKNIPTDNPIIKEFLEGGIW